MTTERERATPRLAEQVASRPSLAGAKLFATLVFTLLGASFIASTALLYMEFRDHHWGVLALTHSHLFLFFPTFGILALVAFHLPSAVFTHLYWYYVVPRGRLRFLHGCGWAILISVGVSHLMLGELATPRHVWEVAPAVLAEDKGEFVVDRREADRRTPPVCIDKQCPRLPALEIVTDLRSKALSPVALAKLGRRCTVAELIEPPEEYLKERWCIPAGKKLTTPQCCVVQEAMQTYVAKKFAEETPRSNLARYEAVLQVFKTFFIVVLLVIAILLIIWRTKIQRLYPDLARRIDWQVMIGACALLLWPVMDYAFQDAANALYGRHEEGLQLRLSLVVAPWLLFILYYFLQRFQRRVEVLGQILGVAGALIAFLARDELRDLATKMTGVGMPSVMFLVFGLALLVGFVALFSPRRWVPDAWRQ